MAPTTRERPTTSTPSFASPSSRRTPPTRRVPRKPRETTLADIGFTVGSAISAVCLAWLIFERFSDGTGWFSFVVASFLLFLAIATVVNNERLGWLVAKDRAVTMVVVTGAVVLLVPLTWLVGYVLVRGLAGVINLTFYTTDQSGITPVMPASEGGISHALVGTIEQVGLALVISVPLGLMCAVFLNETRSRLRRPVRVFVDAMSGLPSIVAGLFIYATLILPFVNEGPSIFGINGFMAALALSMIMLPTVTRTVEVVLRLVPDGLREASLALGSSRARSVWSVVLPTARTGVTTAVVLGIARIVGETAPLLYTAFGQDQMNANPFSGPQESLPLFIWKNIRQPNLASIDRGFAASFVLLALVLILFAIARFVGRDRSRARARARVRSRNRSRIPSPRSLVRRSSQP